MVRMSARTPGVIVGTLCALFLLEATWTAGGYSMPKPGSPSALTDWRWLARQPLGRRTVISDPWGRQKLPRVQGGFLLLEAAGPGVLEHLWTTSADATIVMEVDGTLLWKGSFGDLLEAEDKAGEATQLFPKPVIFGAGGMYHLLAPIGFRRSLRLVTDREELHCYVSYRTFAPGTKVLPASADPKGEYGRGLKAAAELWRKGAYGFAADAAPPAREIRRDFTLDAAGRAVLMDIPGSGEVTHLEFHVNPALTGSLRNVVVEFFYDGAREPSVRLPITDLAGLPHPWSEGRWDSYSGTLAGGLRYPWYVVKPRIYYPEATFYFNLPVPFASGMRIEAANRSDSVRFTGFVRATLRSLPKEEGRSVGRLCGTRVLRPISAEADPVSLIDIPGPGQLVGLGLFLTGNELSRPPAVLHGIMRLTLDGTQKITGHGLLPLWFQGIYGGAVTGQPIWNHPRYGHNYCGVMRHFLTDPIPFDERANFAYTPGSDGTGAPDRATVVALWYSFAHARYAAPLLPDRAEALPYTRYSQTFRNSRLGRQRQDPQVFWSREAEELAPMAQAYGAEVRAVEDTEHNYHPSNGRFLQVVADAAGSHVDCVVRFPHTRYFAIGTNALWGPKRGAFEFDVLSKGQARYGPEFAQGDAFYSGRVLGGGPMKAPVFEGHSLRHRRDPGTQFSPPFLNPAPDGPGILRFVCRSTARGNLLKLDQVGLVMPPPAEKGWHEFEECPTPQVSEGLSGRLPEYGRFDWSGWGALMLSSPKGGRAVVRALVPTGPAKPSALLIKGCLGPKQGSWEMRVRGGGPAVPLVPAKDEKQVVGWKVPVDGLALPGPIALEFTCTAPGEKGPRMRSAPDAQLALDAWTVQ